MTREKILKYTIIFFVLCLLTVSVSFGYSEKNLRQVDQGGVDKKTGVPQMIVGQQPGGGIPGVATQRAVVNVADLARQEALAPLSEKGKAIPPFMPLPHDLVVPTGVETPTEKPPAPESWLPFKTFAPTSPPPSASFLALDDNNTSIPPDVHGAGGPGHLMVTLNTQVRIQNRLGAVFTTVSLDDFWGSLGNPYVFDPKVLYDPYGKRWMFTACADPQSATSSLLIGVSQTSNPTIFWNLYRIDADPTNQVWVDYPSIGFNKNWICVQVNVYNMAGNFNGSYIYVFNKANLYAGGAGLFTLISSSTISGTQVPAITYDTTLSTLYLLQTWNGNDGAGNGWLRLYTITGSVGSEVLSPVAFTSTPNPWDWAGSTGWNDFAPQLGSAQKIMNNDDRMQNLVYRNWSLWATHTVFLPAGGAATRSAVQWWQLTPAGGIIQRARIYEPTGAFYAFPSIAVNKVNDVLIGYSRFSATQYASANYSFRAAADPLNTLQADYVLKAGEAPYYKTFGAGLNRWGNFSNTVVDPVNDINMWTIQEYAATPSGGSDRWGTWWGRIDIDPVLIWLSGYIFSWDFMMAKSNFGGEGVGDAYGWVWWASPYPARNDLWDGGVIVGTNPNDIGVAVRAVGAPNYQPLSGYNEFYPIIWTNVYPTVKGDSAWSEYYSTNNTALKVHMRAFGFDDTLNVGKGIKDAVIQEFTITNTGVAPIADVEWAMFLDMDPGTNAAPLGVGDSLLNTGGIYETSTPKHIDYMTLVPTNGQTVPTFVCGEQNTWLYPDIPLGPYTMLDSVMNLGRWDVPVGPPPIFDYALLMVSDKVTLGPGESAVQTYFMWADSAKITDAGANTAKRKLFHLLKWIGFFRGDVNCSGMINLADVIYLANYILKPGSPVPIPFKDQGEVNCDGIVNLADVIYLANRVLKGTAPPIDYPRWPLQNFPPQPSLFLNPNWGNIGQ